MIDRLLLTHARADGSEVDVVLADGPTLDVSLTVWSAGKSWQTRALLSVDLCRGVVG